MALQQYQVHWKVIVVRKSIAMNKKMYFVFSNEKLLGFFFNLWVLGWWKSGTHSRYLGTPWNFRDPWDPQNPIRPLGPLETPGTLSNLWDLAEPLETPRISLRLPSHHRYSLGCNAWKRFPGNNSKFFIFKNFSIIKISLANTSNR